MNSFASVLFDRGGSLLAKFKIPNLATGSGQILNFEFCGVGSQSSSVVVVVAVVAARAAATFLAKFKIHNLAASAAKKINFELCKKSSSSARRAHRGDGNATRPTDRFRPDAAKFKT